LKIRFLLPAIRELHEAVRYYNAQKPALGNEFRDEAWSTLHRVREFPSAWHVMGGDIRRCQMQRFPYGIIYHASAQEIVVIAIAHLHRDPDYWQARSS
jgi:hypothetical protein